MWRGPFEDGITFSMLERYLCCPERFRVKYVEGLRPREEFNSRMEFGNMWHACEESHARIDTSNVHWKGELRNYAQKLYKLYPMSRDEIGTWAAKCEAVFPLYVDHWSKHPAVVARKPLLSEHVFDVVYRLPSGREVRLRGKWDSVDLVLGKTTDMWLQENKTKSEINEAKIRRQLRFDLQTMLYVVALQHYMRYGGGVGLRDLARKRGGKAQVGFGGVRYNVVKRSAHRQGKKETAQGFLERLAGIVISEPGEWFARWEVQVGLDDIQKFRTQCLDPILENVADDFEWWDYCMVNRDLANSLPVLRGSADAIQYDYNLRRKWFPSHQLRHYRRPFGIYNPIDEGGHSDLDEYLETGSRIGLVTTKMFNELSPE